MTPNTRHNSHIRLGHLLYVILDIRNLGFDAEQIASLAERRGEDSPLSAPKWGRKTKMHSLKKARLQRKGWTIGNTAEFLNLNPQEAQFVELKLALAAGVRQLREQHGMTQAALAEQLGSSQSRVAKMEAADRSVTVDLMVRSLLAIGATPGEIAKLIKRVESHRAA